MWKPTFFVNCSGWAVDKITGKRGYENVHYFKTEKAAQKWISEQNKRLLAYPVDVIKLEKVPFTPCGTKDKRGVISLILPLLSEHCPKKRGKAFA